MVGSFVEMAAAEAAGVEGDGLSGCAAATGGLVRGRGRCCEECSGLRGPFIARGGRFRDVQRTATADLAIDGAWGSWHGRWGSVGDGGGLSNAGACWLARRGSRCPGRRRPQRTAAAAIDGRRGRRRWSAE